jgi:hypothetical protein
LILARLKEVQPELDRKSLDLCQLTPPLQNTSAAFEHLARLGDAIADHINHEVFEPDMLQALPGS